MKNRGQKTAQAAIIATLYATLTHLQNLLLPGSASWVLQLRLSEALCVFALFTPAAAPGLAMGCLLFNLTFSPALPLDFFIGPLATWLAARGMYLTRAWLVGGMPLPALLLPALTNGLLVGWELTVYVGGAFSVNALWVALGEVTVLLIFGNLLRQIIQNRKLDALLFSMHH